MCMPTTCLHAAKLRPSIFRRRTSELWPLLYSTSGAVLALSSSYKELRGAEHPITASQTGRLTAWPLQV